MRDALESRVPILAPPDSLLGQLQRGRGHGVLRALRHDPRSVHGFLLDCILSDPRWDRRRESRDFYYAALAEANGLDLTPIQAHLRLFDSVDRSGQRTFLALQTLSHLAGRKYGEALPILREYLGYGRRWDQVAAALEALGETGALQGIPEVICKRFGSGQELLNSLVEPPLCRSGLWADWARSNPEFARLLEQTRALNGLPQPRSARLGLDDAPPLALVIEEAGPDDEDERIELVIQLAVPADRPALEAAFILPNISAWRVAYRGLRALGVEEVAESILIERIRLLIDSSKPPSEHQWREIDRLCREISLPGQRELRRRAYGEWLGDSASDEAQSKTPDADRLLAQLLDDHHRSQSGGPELERIVATCETLTRFRGQGPFTQLETVFIETGSSRVRRHAAEAIWATSPRTFAQTWALECLWDAEKLSRLLGCRAVAFESPGAVERLHEMATDPYENEYVRRAARARLAPEGLTPARPSGRLAAGDVRPVRPKPASVAAPGPPLAQRAPTAEEGSSLAVVPRPLAEPPAARSPLSWDDLTLAPAALSRIALDPAWESCSSRVVLPARTPRGPLSLDVPFLVLAQPRYAPDARTRFAMVEAARQAGAMVVIEPDDLDRLGPASPGRGVVALEVGTSRPGSGLDARKLKRVVAVVLSAVDLDAPAGYRRRVDWAGPDGLALKIEELRQASQEEVAVWVHLVAGRVFEDVRLAALAGADGIIVDASRASRLGSGRGDGLPTGLPPLPALVEATSAVRSAGRSDEVALALAGGLRHADDCLKALALGADVCGLGEEWWDDIIRAPVGPVRSFADGLATLAARIRDATLAVGKSQVRNLDRDDLRCLSLEAALITGVPLAGSSAMGPLRGWFGESRPN